MKKHIAFLLSLALLLSFLPKITVNATEIGTSSYDKTVVLSSVGHGEYKKIDDNELSAAGNRDMNGIVATLYDKENGIYLIEATNTFVSAIDQGSYLEVKRIEFDLCNEEKVHNLLKANNITGKVAEDISAASKKVSAQKKNTTGILYASVNDDRSTTYYDYGAYQMRLDTFTISNDTFGYQTLATGPSAYSVAKTLTSFTVNVLGCLNEVVSFSATIFNLFTEAVGTVVVESAGTDYLQADIQYDGTIRYAYVKIANDWYLGYQGERVNVDKIMTRQKHTYVNGNHTTAETVEDEASFPSSKKVWKGNHYESYSQAAVNNYSNTLQEFVTHRIYNVVFDFRFD